MKSPGTSFARAMKGEAGGRLKTIAAPAPARDGVQLYDPATIRRSPFQSKDRIVTDSPAFEKFLRSVEQNGVLQNGIIRPVNPPEGKICWELIAGERRWTAATMAKVPFPAAVRDVGDLEAIEIQARENNEREDLNAMDEAEKFLQLQQRYEGDLKMSKTEAMNRMKEITGKGESTIYGRMTLMKLPTALQNMVRMGVLPPSHGELITKVEHPDLRAQLLKEILKPQSWQANDEGILSFRKAKEATENALRRDKCLRDFETVKTKSKPGQFAQVFDQKRSDQDRHRSEWVELKDRAEEFCKDWNDETTWKQLTKGKTLPAATLMHNHDGSPLVKYPRDLMLAVAKQNGHTPGAKSGRSGSGGGNSLAKQQAAHRVRIKAFTGLLAGVASSAEHMDGPELLRFLFEGVVRFGGRDSVHRVVKRRKIEVDAKYKYNEAGALSEAMKAATGRELRGLLAELIFQRFSPSSYQQKWDAGFAEACKLFGVPLPPWSAAKLKKGNGSQASGNDGEEEDDAD